MGVGNIFKGYESVFAGIRMTWQMIYRLIITFVVIQLLTVSSLIYFNHNKYFGILEKEDFCLFKTYYLTQFKYKFSFIKNNVTVMYTCEGNQIELKYDYFISKFEPYILKRMNRIIHSLKDLFVYTSFMYLILPILLIYFSSLHRNDSKDKYIRGAKFISSKRLSILLKKYLPDFMFRITQNISIPLKILNRHSIILGRPGTGKTQLILRVIDQIIHNGFRAIIHDFKGDFITTFYNYKNHFIFNPLDKRHMGLKDFQMHLIDQAKGLRKKDLNAQYASSQPILKVLKDSDEICSEINYSTLLDEIPAIIENISPKSDYHEIKDECKNDVFKIKGWSIFNELSGPVDIEAFCSSLIPESASHDNFWPISSRQILGSILTYCFHNKIFSYAEVWKMVNLENERLLSLFKSTPGCEEGIKLLTEAKTANNILAVLSNYTKPFRYLIGTEGNFSIKKWVQNSSDPRKIIFLSNYAMIQESIKPFLTMFADFSIKTLLSLEDDLNRRLILILEEFGELGKIGTIIPFLTGSRSKGGAGFILIQDTARISSIYGKEGCSTIINSCGNLVSFGVKKDESEFVSDCFGTAEIKRTEESKSMGVDDISDSISISKSTVEKKVVMPSEITNIPTLNFYIQLTDMPVSKDALDIIQFNKVSSSYIGREDLLFNTDDKSRETSNFNNSISVLNENDFISEIESTLDEQSYFGELIPETVTASINEENSDNPDGMVL